MAQRIYYEYLCGRLYRVAVADSGALIYRRVVADSKKGLVYPYRQPLKGRP